MVKITGANISADGTISVQFTVSDPRGAALDIAGVDTPGTVTSSFVAACIPHGTNNYVALTTAPQTGATARVMWDSRRLPRQGLCP